MSVIDNTALLELFKHNPGGYHCCEYDVERGFPFVYISQCFLDVLGWTKEEIESEFSNSLRNMIHPDDIVENFSNKDMVFRLRGKDGYHWVIGITSDLEIDGKKYSCGTVSDISYFINNQNKLLEDTKIRTQAIQSLGEIYSTIHTIDIKNNFFTELSSIGMVKREIGNCGNAQDSLNYFVSWMVTEEDKKEVLDFVNLETLEERLGNKHIITQQYRVASADGVGWRQCHFIESERDADGRLAHVIFTTQSIHDNKIKELEAQEELKRSNEEYIKLLKEERQHSEIIGALANIFSTMYYADLREKIVQRIISHNHLDYTYGDKENAEAVIKHITENYVAKEYQANIYSFLELDTMNQRLRDKGALSYEFNDNNNIWCRVSLIPVNTDEEGNVVSVLAANRNISQEKEVIDTQKNIITALALPYEDTFVVNSATGEAVSYRMAKVVTDRFGQAFAIGNYEQNIAMYVERDVLEEDKHIFDEFRKLEDVNRLLNEKNTLTFNFRTFKGTYYQVLLVKPDVNRSEFVVGFKNVDDQIRRQLKINREVEIQREIIEGLGAEYFSILLVDIEKDKVKVFRSNGRHGSVIEEHCKNNDYIWSKSIDSDSTLISHDYRDSFARELSLENLSSKDDGFSFLFETRNGERISYFQARVAFVTNADGKKVAVVGTRDVDEMIKKEKKQEQELKDAYLAAEAANNAKTSFLFNMSHDIRTPMNAIIGLTELIEKNIDDKEKVLDYLSKIKNSNQFLLSLINNVLEMARIESGKERLDESLINIYEFLETLYQLMFEQIRKKHITFRHEIDIIHENIFADDTKMREILLNLLSNAVKYTADGGRIKLTIRETPSDKPGISYYEAIVEDNGIGMSKDFLPHIFEDFSREKTSTESKVSGTGLGMPIVKRLVDLMKGEIRVESELGVGSRFIISIPHRIALENEAVKQDYEIEYDEE
ncbi:MAG: PAS domain-containing sensor histidine kinase [Erysipelotrichaceae bacterium]|nr:PAS domain-containing sensor histidine kinase [Erysipelotrichaceae bacterium]